LDWRSGQLSKAVSIPLCSKIQPVKHIGQLFLLNALDLDASGTSFARMKHP
jgi:hypothetical protein